MPVNLWLFFTQIPKSFLQPNRDARPSKPTEKEDESGDFDYVQLRDQKSKEDYWVADHPYRKSKMPQPKLQPWNSRGLQRLASGDFFQPIRIEFVKLRNF